jgi:hypothetical protein
VRFGLSVCRSWIGIRRKVNDRWRFPSGERLRAFRLGLLIPPLGWHSQTQHSQQTGLGEQARKILDLLRYLEWQNNGPEETV